VPSPAMAGVGRRVFGCPYEAVNSVDRVLPWISRSLINITLDRTHTRKLWKGTGQYGVARSGSEVYRAKEVV
jgi:hypothetical protein